MPRHESSKSKAREGRKALSNKAGIALVKQPQTDSLSILELEVELIVRMFGCEIAALFGAIK